MRTDNVLVQCHLLSVAHNFLCVCACLKSPYLSECFDHVRQFYNKNVMSTITNNLNHLDDKRVPFILAFQLKNLNYISQSYFPIRNHNVRLSYPLPIVCNCFLQLKTSLSVKNCTTNTIMHNRNNHQCSFTVSSTNSKSSTSTRFITFPLPKLSCSMSEVFTHVVMNKSSVQLYYIKYMNNYSHFGPSDQHKIELHFHLYKLPNLSFSFKFQLS